MISFGIFSSDMHKFLKLTYEKYFRFLSMVYINFIDALYHTWHAQCSE